MTTTDESIMGVMLDRATNPTREVVDELGVQMFCMLVKSDVQLVSKAQEMLIAKIQSTNVTESTRAINVLEECMSKCGPEFQDETSKFRFLNELIRLVSKKYLGAETPEPIKRRIMECLLLWTTEYPKKSKIKEAYDMLSKEGVVEHGNSMSSTATAAAANRENVLGIDEETLARLIKSNDPENFKRANLLIQHRVNQDARRSELILQHKYELHEVENTVNLLSQMLETYETDISKDGKEDSDDTENLIRELYLSCKKHKPILQRLAELMETIDEDLLAETLEVNDSLQAVMERYNKTIVHQSSKAQKSSGKATPSAISSSNLEKEVDTGKSNTNDLLSELLGVTSEQMAATLLPIQSDKEKSSTSKINTLDELHEIFSKVDNVSEVVNKSPENEEKIAQYPSQLLSSLNLLEPVNVFSSGNTNVSDDSPRNDDSKQEEDKRAFRELRDIDALSEELMKQNLKNSERIGGFNKKEPEKLTLNDLVKERSNVKSSTVEKTSLKAEDGAAKLAVQDEKKSTPVSPMDDDEILPTNTTSEIKIKEEIILNHSADEEPKPVSIKQINTETLKHLSDITVDLDDLTPKAEDERVLLDDEDVKITLNFTEDRPSRNISVIVLAVANKSKMRVKDFQLEASVKKPCKVRLLPPTDTELPPFKPYRPPTPINQILLLLNPTGKPVDITCIIGYKLGDDPDPIKESIIAKSIPYVD